MTLCVTLRKCRLPILGLTLVGLLTGCVSDSIHDKRLARYRPNVSDRGVPVVTPRATAVAAVSPTLPVTPPPVTVPVMPPAAVTPVAVTNVAPVNPVTASITPVPVPVKPVETNVAAVAGAASNVTVDAALSKAMAKTLKRGDKVTVELRGIPDTQLPIKAEVDDAGLNLPLIGRIKISNMTAFDAERLIEKAYVEGGFYNKINVIVTSQDEEYFVQGEVKKEGKYPLSGDQTLLQAISAAGGYTDFAKNSKVTIRRGQGKRTEVLHFDCDRIEKLKDKDPMIMPGDIIVVPRRWIM